MIFAIKNKFKIVYLMISVFIALFGIQTLAKAQGLDLFDVNPINSSAQNTKFEETDPFYIAMIFYRFSGKAPDFRDMVMNSDEYKMTADNEKIYIIERLVEEYRSTYSLITMQEPIVLEADVKLSNYNEKLGGFLIENFNSNFFFVVEAMGKNYALIPEGIVDKQWMKVEDKNIGKKIEQQYARAILMRDPLRMSFTLTPVYSDATKPIVINNKEYWLMSVKPTSMVLYAPETEEVLWKSINNTLSTDDSNLEDLKKLRQH